MSRCIRLAQAAGIRVNEHQAEPDVKSCLVWPLFMPLTCPLASCPETGHPLFVSTHVANSWVTGALAAATARRICRRDRHRRDRHRRGHHRRRGQRCGPLPARA
jgi:hypothetical protein